MMNMSGAAVASSSSDGLVDLSELKSLVNEMNQGLEFENLNTDGSQSHIRFRSTKYPQEFFSNLHAFLEHEKFCDVTLRLSSVSNDVETGLVNLFDFTFKSFRSYNRTDFKIEYLVSPDSHALK